MKYGIIGTGGVAHAIATKLIELGHEVMMGARSATNEKAVSWTKSNGERAFNGTFADAARFGERVFNCVQGIHSLEALHAAGKENLNGKLLIDLANPYIYKDGHIALDSRWSGTTSLGEETQNLLPDTKVVKTLNYLCNHLMVHPGQLPDAITGFYCGNDADAKAEAAALLKDFGWEDTLDLGDISMSRYTEMLGAFWPAALNATGNMEWGFSLVRKQ